MPAAYKSSEGPLEQQGREQPGAPPTPLPGWPATVVREPAGALVCGGNGLPALWLPAKQVLNVETKYGTGDTGRRSEGARNVSIRPANVDTRHVLQLGATASHILGWPSAEAPAVRTADAWHKLSRASIHAPHSMSRHHSATPYSYRESLIKAHCIFTSGLGSPAPAGSSGLGRLRISSTQISGYVDGGLRRNFWPPKASTSHYRMSTPVPPPIVMPPVEGQTQVRSHRDGVNFGHHPRNLTTVPFLLHRLSTMSTRWAPLRLASISGPSLATSRPCSSPSYCSCCSASG